MYSFHEGDSPLGTRTRVDNESKEAQEGAVSRSSLRYAPLEREQTCFERREQVDTELCRGFFLQEMKRIALSELGNRFDFFGDKKRKVTAATATVQVPRTRARKRRKVSVVSLSSDSTVTSFPRGPTVRAILTTFTAFVGQVRKYIVS